MKTPQIDRRHLLKFLGGSALGTVLSPLPWKVLDDVSIWTQNWSWIPVPPKGETVIRQTACALCPAGCGLKVRCVGTRPVSLSGLGGHPASRGFLCPGGLVGHHLPYHPQRLTQPVRLTRGAREASGLSAEQAVRELGNVLTRLRAGSSAGRVAVIDSWPGRTTSLVYRRFASEFPNGAYVVLPDRAQTSLSVFDGIGGEAYPEQGIDLEGARTILSFGSDLFEGGTLAARLLAQAQSGEPGPRVTQIESHFSRTAALADTWLPVRPGTEPILALGIAAEMVRERVIEPSVSPLVERMNASSDFRDLLVALTPARCAEICEIRAEAVSAAAREMRTNRPSLALAGQSSGGGSLGEDDYLAVNLLNLLSGAVGSRGGLAPRRRLPEIDPPMAGLASPTELCQVPDGSIAFLIIDDAVLRQSIPAAVLKRKLVPDGAAVVCLSSFGTGYSNIPHYRLPVPLYLETLEEIPTPADSPVASFSLSVPLLAPPAVAAPRVEWINRLARAARLDWPDVSHEGLAEAQIKAIWRCKRGSVYCYAEDTTKPAADFGSAEELGKAFKSGACWFDSPADPIKPNWTASVFSRPETWGRLKRVVNQRIEMASNPEKSAVTLVPFTPGFAVAASPLAAKLTRESDLYPQPGDAFVSPATAARLGIGERQQAELETSKGKLRVRIRLDETAAPGVVFGPVWGTSDARDLCDVTKDHVWRPTAAQLRRLDV